MGFELLGLSNALLRAVSDAGYTVPTPIQEQAIPSILMNRDIMGIAQTGTGKTAGFTLPMIDILSQGRSRARMPRSLILEPTRELAAQVEESFEKYGKNHKLTKALLIGGVNFADQEKALDRGVDVLIATPGRLLDHFERGKLMLTGVEILVIDEADRMLDMGFIPDVEKICSLITKNHQTLFFSATMAGPIKKLADRFLDNPKIIEVAKAATTATNVSQYIVKASTKQKREALRQLINNEDIQNAIIFCNRKVEVKEVHDSLKRHKFSVGQLHGDMVQSARMEMLRAFKNNEVQLLVASDVAARGLDIPAVSHVFNFDIPSTSEDYVHRIGRTGRAGRSGKAFTIVNTTKTDAKLLDAIEKLIGQKIELFVLGDQNTDATEKSIKRDKKAAPTDKKPAPTDKKPAPAPKKSKSADKEPADAKKPDEPKSKAPVSKEIKEPTKNTPTKAKNDKNTHQDRWPSSVEAHPPKKTKYGKNSSQDDVGVMEDEQLVGLGSNIPAFLQNAVIISSR